MVATENVFVGNWARSNEFQPADRLSRQANEAPRLQRTDPGFVRIRGRGVSERRRARLVDAERCELRTTGHY